MEGYDSAGNDDDDDNNVEERDEYEFKNGAKYRG